MRGWVGKGILSINSLSRATAGKVSDWIPGSHKSSAGFALSIGEASGSPPCQLCHPFALEGAGSSLPDRAAFVSPGREDLTAANREACGPALPEKAFSIPMPRDSHLCQPVAPPALLPAGARWGQSAAQERLFWVVTASKGSRFICLPSG